MYKFFVFIALMLGSSFLMAQPDTLKSSSTIDKVTVYREGAQVSRWVNFSAQKGLFYLSLDSLPEEIIESAISVSTSSPIEIIGIEHSIIYPSDIGQNKTIKKLEDQIEAYRQSLLKIKNALRALDTEEDILLKNSALGSEEKGVSVSELREAGKFYNNRLMNIGLEELALQNKNDSLVDKIKAVYAKINKVSVRTQKNYSRVAILIESKVLGKMNVRVSYVLPSAGWEPSYDLRISDTKKPAKMDYKATVYQNSGEDWKKVDVTLSNANPSLSNISPKLNPWIVDRPEKNTDDTSEMLFSTERSSGAAGCIKGKIFDKETGEALPFVNVVLLQNGEQVTGSTSDFDGHYAIKPIAPGIYDVSVSFVGYQAKKIASVSVQGYKITFLDVELEGGLALEAVEVVKYKMPLIDKDATSGSSETITMPGRSSRSIATQSGGVSIRGARTDGDFVYIDGVKVRGSRALPQSNLTELVDNEMFATKRLNMDFSIDGKQTLPSDAKDHIIRIKSEELPFNFVYRVVPKQDKDVFLLAELSPRSKYPFLSGLVNTYYDGAYTGLSFLDAQQSSDTLSFSVMREKNIVCTRLSNKTLNERKLFGSNIKETLVWDIELRNNNSTAATILLEDQIPIAERSSVEISADELGGAEHNNETGMLSWKVELKPGESKKIRYQYSIKYPSGLRLYNY